MAKAEKLLNNPPPDKTEPEMKEKKKSGRHRKYTTIT